MNENFTPPTTRDAVFEMIAPLDPDFPDLFTFLEKKQAYDRLMEFFDLLIPE